MVETRVRLVSDSHLSSRTPEALANWDAVVEDVATDPPDLLVHIGDVTLDGAAGPDDLQVARNELGLIATELAVIPGNHDVGDNPHAGNTGSARTQLVTPERLAAYRDELGPDRWTVDVPGWRLVGVNTLLFGSGLADEADQWTWLSSVLGAADGPSPSRTALVLHKPLLPPSAEVDDAPGRYVPVEARDRLLELVGRRLALVVSGHAHQFSEHLHVGVPHVWVPSSWATIPDRFQRRLAEKVCGIVDLELPADGEARASLRQPTGLVQNVLVDGIPDPYTHRNQQAPEGSRTPHQRTGGTMDR